MDNGNCNQLLWVLAIKFILQIVSTCKVSWSPLLQGQLEIASGVHYWEESRKYRNSWRKWEMYFMIPGALGQTDESDTRVSPFQVATMYNFSGNIIYSE